MKLAEDLLDTCRSKNLKFAAAESCTGGMVMAALTDIAGSSDVVDRGFVTYSNEAKEQMLGVSPEVLREFGAVSKQVAQQMADGALANSMADIAISITGVAGPGASEAKPEGLVWFGLAMKGAPTQTVQHKFGALGRAVVRQRSVEAALELALEAVQAK